ncbi:MAG: NAD(P)H-dependent oxidoreductase subunit E [Vicinamibacteria bacterium]|nr:NAD(P)H-dependent oxidoreductase subunit E [Vicinamibacteria bacterium]
MDLHFTSDEPTADEREAVDALLGPPESSWRGGARDPHADTRHVDGGRAVRELRHLLLPALHALQGRRGWISPGGLNYVSARLGVPPADTYGVASFYGMFSTTERPPTVVHVCDDVACAPRGAEALCAELERRCGPAGSSQDGRATWQRSPCLGLCERGPAAFVQQAGAGREDQSLAPASADALEAVLRGREVPERPGTGSVPQAGSPELRLLTRVDVADPASLDDYRAHGGYRALRRALQVGPAEVLRELHDSKLAGRGGAAFPAGVKWKAVAEAPARPHYLICNADESEPGTFKDRVLMEQDPFAVVEAMTIAGYAVGAERGFLYVRGEYPEATRRLAHAIGQARQRGFLGANVLERDFSFEIEIRRGAGAYICGEETALMESIEGKRGEPRNKPPFPVHVGLFGKPTAINNVETLVNVLEVIAHGGDAFAGRGTAASTGTKLFCLSGCIEKPGVYEVHFGATLGELIALGGGVRDGRPLQAVLLGGAAGVFVGPAELDMPLTLEGARERGATLGSGVVLVFDDHVDLKPILARIAAFFRDESCGQCVPCRVGTVRQEEALARLLAGGADEARERALLAELEQVMKDASICGLGQTASGAIQSAIRRLGMFGGRA